MNALGDPRVAEYLNENFVCTFQKVGTFQIVNGQKQGGNVASYFCLGDGSVIHAVAGQVGAGKFLSESRWAYEIRKAADTHATDLGTGAIDMKEYRDKLQRGHAERFHAERGNANPGRYVPVPMHFPEHANQNAQVHWYLSRSPLMRLETVYPFVWTRVLGETLSDAPVAQR